jgi:ATP-binding cassette, subfamily B, bacterial HlyB/CyaB
VNVIALEPIEGPGESITGSAGSLLSSFVIAARFRGIHLTVPQLIHDHLLSSDDVPVSKLIDIAQASGLRAVSTRFAWKDLLHLGKALPVIVRLRNGSSMVLLRAHPKADPPHVVLQDPSAREDAVLALDEYRFATAWTGEVVLLKRDYRVTADEQPFSLRMIAGLLLQDRRIVRDIAISAFLLSLLAVAPIMFWRLLIDRVLYYQNLNTFTVLCVAMGILIAFDTAFGYLRRYMVQIILRRVDAKLSTNVFDQILNLPMEFFERTPTGKTVHDVHEIYRIRNFLTHQLFGTMLDALVLVVFLPIMFFFSVLLTSFVLGICAVICLYVVMMLPTIQIKGGRVARAESQKGSFLVETLQGIRTVKSLALDARRRHDWDVLVANAADRRFEEASTINMLQTVVAPLGLLMTSGVIALGVYMVITTQENVYVGALVAFMMLTQRVAAPLLQLSFTVQQYDEARIAIGQISALVNQPPEEGRSQNGVQTPFVGRVEFSNVRFSYRGAASPALDEVSFTIPAGTTFGIMGRSGSGKTTVTRLLQMLHSNYQGLIKIDGNDLRQIDVDHLRSSTGVVLQENFLFRGTIRETIGATKPDATFEEIVLAARLAGAEEFIERLPGGYETFIQEGSTNLSGGQRQRLAIARALISDPRILILDEATSALDAESEAIVNANMMRIAKGRTVIIISHRLSSLVTADAIMVLERGRVYNIGRHDELLERCDIYSGLWHQQHRHLRPVTSHAG